MSENAETSRENTIIQAPEPGLYFDVPFSDYLAWDAVQSSTLRKIRAESAAHYQAEQEDDQEEEKDDYFLGTLLHAAVLEPDDLLNRYVPGPRGNASTKKFKDAMAHLRATFPEHEPVRARHWDVMEGVVSSVRSHARAARILDDPGPVECTVVWIDEATGLKCKARIDKVCEHLGATVDLKSTRSADPRRFQYAVRDHGYHIQGAFHLMGWDAVRRLEGGNMPYLDTHVVIAVEKKEPFVVETGMLSENAIQFGLSEIRDLMAYYKHCREQGQWPGYSDGRIVEIDLPRNTSHWVPPIQLD